MFYDNYEMALQKTHFTPDRIFNLDETNIMTVVQAPNVIAHTGMKQVGQCVSAERGQLITMCAIVNATGNTVPPVFIFPRARFHEAMINGAPPGSVGYANSPKSGWMTGPLFLKVLQHIKKFTRCSPDDRILLLFDNHESHCTLDAINYCRDNGIVVVTFPPHCTHRMQPLDVAVNGPFKQKISVAQNDWLLQHPGRTITIHDLPAIVTPAYNASHTPKNIISGFTRPGIYPFNRNAFTDDDFQCAEVTNRPQPTTSAGNEEPVIANAITGLHMTQTTSLAPEETDQRASPSILESPALGIDQPIVASHMPQIVSSRTDETVQRSSSEAVPGLITPEMIQPYPKVPPRKDNARGRKKGSSRILTDTPEKNAIEAAHLIRMKNLEKSALRSRTRKPLTTVKQAAKGKQLLKGKQLPKPKYKSKQRSIFTSSSELDDNDSNFSLNDDLDLDATDASDIHNEDEETLEHDDSTPFTSQSLNVGDFVLVQCPSEKRTASLAFVARIEEKDLNTFTVNYLKRKGDMFYFPEKVDRWSVTILDIVKKLPAPNNAPSTSRTAGRFSFNFNFSFFRMG